MRLETSQPWSQQDEEDVEDDEDDDESPKFFEPEDLIQLGTTALDGAKTVAGAVGSGLSTVKHQVGGRVVGAGWNALTCTVGRGWNTLSEAADFWLVKDINEAEAQFYMEEEATANRLKMKQASAAATKRANDVTAATANYSTCPHDDERSNLNNGHQKNQACETSSQPSMLITNDALIHQEEPIHPQNKTDSCLVSPPSSSPSDVTCLENLDKGKQKYDSDKISTIFNLENISHEQGDIHSHSNSVVEQLESAIIQPEINDVKKDYEENSDESKSVSTLPLNLSNIEDNSITNPSSSLISPETPIKESNSWVDLPTLDEEEWEYVDN